MEYGYMRVSTKEQNERRQFIALQEYGIGNNRMVLVNNCVGIAS